MIKTAIIGMGARGAEVYAKYSLSHPEELKIVAIADIDCEKLEKYANIYQVPKEMCFKSGEELLNNPKLADAIFIASPDKAHFNHTIKALELGYDILLEKPISPSKEECIEIVQEAKKQKRVVAICHVLRYAPFYSKIKEIIDSGKLGKIVSINQIENVGYWHQAHSFVRGNWRNSVESSPMILAKCCHDLDIISWFTGKECLKVSSFGSLKHFKKECAPIGATKRCLGGCKVKDKCPYDAEKIYIENFKKYPVDNRDCWPFVVLNPNPTIKSLTIALKEGPYGRCVYDCDNDVVDHQTVNMQFTDGITANLTMAAFSGTTYRQVKVMGTRGEITADDNSQKIEVKIYDGTFDVKLEVIDIKKMYAELKGHGGGDELLVRDFIQLLESGSEEGTYLTAIDNSLQSHLMAFASEESRINHGKVIEIKQED